VNSGERLRRYAVDGDKAATVQPLTDQTSILRIHANAQGRKRCGFELSRPERFETADGGGWDRDGFDHCSAVADGGGPVLGP
jgi:hypothetical protein